MTPIPDGGGCSACGTLGHSCGTGDMVPLVNRTFEWGAVIATFLSVLSTVPRRCTRLTDFLHPKLRKRNAVPIALKPVAPPLRCLRRAVLPIPNPRPTRHATPTHAHRHHSAAGSGIPL